jgi:hypothetical protein
LTSGIPRACAANIGAATIGAAMIGAAACGARADDGSGRGTETGADGDRSEKLPARERCS